MLQIIPQFDVPSCVVQKPAALKQQYGPAVVEQIELPPFPPCAHIHPLVYPHRSRAFRHCKYVGKLHPEKQRSCARHDIPGQAQICVLQNTANVFLEYPGAFPGSPKPQQHIREPPPAPPHISIVSVPQPGDVQHHNSSLLIQVSIDVGLTTQTLPFSRLFWLAIISLVDSRSDSFAIFISVYGPMNTQPNVAPEYTMVIAALFKFNTKSSAKF